MSRLIELLELVNKPNIDFGDAIEFVELAYPMVMKGEVPNRNEIVDCFNKGLGPQLISKILDTIEYNPSEYGLEVDRLYSKDGILIKTYYRDIEEVCEDKLDNISEQREESNG